jgi:hypothetical protein
LDGLGEGDLDDFAERDGDGSTKVDDGSVEGGTTI